MNEDVGGHATEKVIDHVRKELGRFVSQLRRTPAQKKVSYIAALNGKALLSPSELAAYGVTPSLTKELSSTINDDDVVVRALATLHAKVEIPDARHPKQHDHKPPQPFIRILTIAR